MILRRPLVPLCAVTLFSVLLFCISPVLLILPIFGSVLFGVICVRKGHKARVYAALSLIMAVLSLYPLFYENLHFPIKPNIAASLPKYCTASTVRPLMYI